MIVTRGTIGRLRAQVAKATAALPPRVWFLTPGDGERRKEWDERVATAHREAAAFQEATGRRAVVFFVDTAEDE